MVDFFGIFTVNSAYLFIALTVLFLISLWEVETEEQWKRLSEVSWMK